MSRSSAAGALSADAELVLKFFQEQYFGGRPPVYSPLEVARGVFPRTDSPAPGSTFDPTTWGRVNDALRALRERGLIEIGRLPQGDTGYVLVVEGQR
jgi:hypothetical protein